ncbi:7-dehydrocholesterol reductase [Thozetella sp. PMI_491]|nr:7-dehydrocholesterol reductase [Thozetella sp. PMI_491]
MHKQRTMRWANVVGQEVACFLLVVTCPLFNLFFWISYQYFGASLSTCWAALVAEGPSFFLSRLPYPTKSSVSSYLFWILLQGLLYLFLPGPIHRGSRTPGGRQLQYKLNGLSAWVCTTAIALVASHSQLIDPAFIAENWGSILTTANIYCFILICIFSIKAHMRPDNAEDTFLTGRFWYDLFNGGELHPRTGSMFDWKHFNASRSGGILAWTLIFFETLDGAYECFSFYSIYGFAAMMPQIWTLQTQYLALHPTRLSFAATICGMALFALGWFVNHYANDQKSLSRRTGGKCKIWGHEAQCLEAVYRTADGKTHRTILLCSGWWGTVRHANYFGSVLYTWSSCVICGTAHIFPYAEAIIVTILVVHRCFRDEARCKKKYGKTWDQYCRIVRWRIIPGVF